MTNSIKFKKDIATSALHSSVTIYHVIVDGRNIGSVKRSGGAWVGSTALRHGETVTGRTRAAAAEELVRVHAASKAPVARPVAVGRIDSSARNEIMARLSPVSDEPSATPAAVTVMPAGPTVSLLVAPANERMAGCRDGFRVYTVGDQHRKGAYVGLVAPLAFDSGPLPADARWRFQRLDGTGGTEKSRDAAALALVPADGWPLPFQRSVKGPGTVLALLLLIMAPYLGACATQATRTRGTYDALADTGLRSAAAANEAMRNTGNDSCDCDNAESLSDPTCKSACAPDELPCDATTAPDVDVSGSNPGDDDDYVMTPAETQIYAYLTQSCAPRAKPDTAVVSRIEGTVAVLLVGREGNIEQRVGLDVLPRGVKKGDVVPWTHSVTPGDTYRAVAQYNADSDYPAEDCAALTGNATVVSINPATNVARVRYDSGTRNQPVSTLPRGTRAGSKVPLRALCEGLQRVAEEVKAPMTMPGCKHAVMDPYEGQPSCLDIDSATLAAVAPLTIHAASENEADAVEAAVKARKPLAPGAEVIQAACSVAWKVWDTGKTWRFVCDSTGTVIEAPKSTADAGLTSTTVGNPSAEWVR